MGKKKKPADGVKLPDGFEPEEMDIVCGRGKGSYNRKGNKRCREVVREFVPQYASAKNKVDKGIVLSAIVDRLTAEKSRFIKQVKGDWIQLSKDQSREKIGHVLREVCSEAQGEKQMQSMVSAQSGLLSKQQSIFQQMVAAGGGGDDETESEEAAASPPKIKMNNSTTPSAVELEARKFRAQATKEEAV